MQTINSINSSLDRITRHHNLDGRKTPATQGASISNVVAEIIDRRPITEVWGEFGGDPPKRGRARAFYREGDNRFAVSLNDAKGCWFDQGALKSTSLRVLAGDDFFTDDIADLGSKDSVIQARGVWVIELAELDSMSRPEASRVKAFMSHQVDRIRLPYDRRVTDVPRECIFAGTVNNDTYLKDETGGRRFWPIKVGKIDIDSLRRDRDQLWAEARDCFQSKAKWWLDIPELVEAARNEQQARYEGDAWDDEIVEFVSTRSTVSVAEILECCFDKPKKDWTRSDEQRIARSLKSNGWIRCREIANNDGKRPWGYRRGPKQSSESQPL